MSTKNSRTFGIRKAFGVGVMLLFVAPRVHAEKYAVLIGINSYKDSTIATLRGAAADAQSVAKTLIDHDGFVKQNVHILVSDGKSIQNLPTRENIAQELDWLVKVSQPGDTVFFFYAGHGTQYDKQAWLLPYDVNTHGPFALKHSALSAEELHKDFDSLHASLLVTAFDMCRKPKEFQDDKSSRGIGFGFRLGVLQTRSLSIGHPDSPKAKEPASRASISMFACQAGQYSWESNALGRGFFSKSLEQALSGEADTSGNLTIRSIVDFVRDSVPANVDAFGLSERQEPESMPSSDSVYQRVFATGFQPRMSPNPKKTKTPTTVANAADLKPRDVDDEYVESFKQGFKLYRRKAYRDAQVHFEKALSAKKTASVLRILGDCRYFQKDRVGAKSFFNSALEVDPNYSPAYSDLGYLEDVDFHHLKEAESLFRRAMECDRDNPVPVNNIARVFRQQKRFKECLEMYRKAVELDPNSGLFEANLALELNNQNFVSEAKEHARIAKELGLKDHLVFQRLNMEDENCGDYL